MPELECIARILELEYNKISRGLYLPINISCRLGNLESGTGVTRAGMIVVDYVRDDQQRAGSSRGDDAQ